MNRSSRARSPLRRRCAQHCVAPTACGQALRFAHARRPRRCRWTPRSNRIWRTRTIHGRWAGKRFDEIQAEHPEGIAAWLTDPDTAPHGGESLADVARRASNLMGGLIAERGHTVAITHASIIRTAILHVLGAPLAACWKIDIEPLSITDFAATAERHPAANPVKKLAGQGLKSPHAP
jgi:hypothetical protein